MIRARKERIVALKIGTQEAPLTPQEYRALVSLYSQELDQNESIGYILISRDSVEQMLDACSYLRAGGGSDAHFAWNKWNYEPNYIELQEAISYDDEEE